MYANQYVVNPNSEYSQVLIKTDAQGKQTFYVYGLGLIGQEEAGVYKTYHYDLRGSTVALTDINGNVTDRFQYGPYGEPVYRSGTTATPFLYDGRDGVMTDSNGLYYMRARYYNPELRRFINQDVVLGSIDKGQSLNRYAYVNGNPVTFVDPFGLSRRYYYQGTLTYQEKVLAKAKSPNATTWDKVNGWLWQPTPDLTGVFGVAGRASFIDSVSGAILYAQDNKGQRGILLTGGGGLGSPTGETINGKLPNLG